MGVKKTILSTMATILYEDKKNISYLLYYSFIEAVLVLSIPLASAYIINSVLAHASTSVTILGIIVIVIFILTTLLQVVKEYIIEKFQQKIFVSTGIKIAEMATRLDNSIDNSCNLIDKYMNYFFDITAIQKFFPILLLDGSGLIVKVIISSLLLLSFNPLFFGLGLVFFILFVVLLLLFGRNGIDYAIKRSDAKHSAIYFMQNIPNNAQSDEKILEDFDGYLTRFVDARTKIFGVIIRQLTLTFFMEGIILSSFLIGGGYLVINGELPIGEFVAAEIVVVSITYSLKGFMKQIDYIYDMIEGFYKVDKLSLSLDENSDA